MNNIKFQNYSDLLSSLDGKEFNDYIICRCPSCKVKEAFIYKSSNNLKCNRENQCGENYKIEFIEKNQELPKFKDDLKVERDKCFKFINTMFSEQYFDHIEDLEVNNYRGLQNPGDIYKIDNIKGLDIKNPQGLYEYTIKTLKPMLSDINQRNIMHCLRNENGKIETILLRGDETTKLKIKEKQIKLVSNNIDYYNNFKDDSNKIFLCEGMTDAKTLEQKYNDVQIIGLTGVLKQSKMLNYLEKNKNKNKEINIFFDNDKAGQNSSENIKNKLQKQGYKEIKIINNYNSFKGNDINELLMNGELNSFCKKNNIDDNEKSHLQNKLTDNFSDNY